MPSGFPSPLLINNHWTTPLLALPCLAFKGFSRPTSYFLSWSSGDPFSFSFFLLSWLPVRRCRSLSFSLLLYDRSDLCCNSYLVWFSMMILLVFVTILCFFWVIDRSLWNFSAFEGLVDLVLLVWLLEFIFGLALLISDVIVSVEAVEILFLFWWSGLLLDTIYGYDFLRYAFYRVFILSFLVLLCFFESVR